MPIRPLRVEARRTPQDDGREMGIMKYDRLSMVYESQHLESTRSMGLAFNMVRRRLVSCIDIYYWSMSAVSRRAEPRKEVLQPAIAELHSCMPLSLISES